MRTGEYSVGNKKTKPARIISLLTDAYGGHGGISRFNRDFLSALSQVDKCFEIVVFPRLVPNPVDEDIPSNIVYKDQGITNKIGYIGNIFRYLLLDRNFGLVVCGHINLLPIAWAVSKIVGAPLIMIVHGIDAWKPTRSRLVNFLASKVSRLVAVSQTTIDRFQNWSHIEEGKTYVLPNCVDLTGFTPGPKNPELLARYDIKDKKIIMTLGRMAGFDRFKGFDEILEALPDLINDIPDLVYVLAGDGPDKERLMNKAVKLGVSKHTVFTGMVEEDEKVDHYRLADGYVMPSRGEGFGIVLLEAMSCGVPVFASKLDGSREALLNGKLGDLVNPENKNEIIQATKAVLDKPKHIPEGLSYFSKGSFENRVRDLVHEFFALN